MKKKEKNRSGKNKLGIITEGKFLNAKKKKSKKNLAVFGGNTCVFAYSRDLGNKSQRART